MPYTSIDVLRRAYGALEVDDLADRDRDRDPVKIEGVVADVIAQTDDVIDSHLRGRYEVPLATTPGLIATCAKFIARYYLSEDHASERVEADYDKAMKWLDLIRKGSMDPGIDQASAAPEVKTGGPQHRKGTQAFPADGLDDWIG